MGDLVRLECDTEAIDALAASFDRYGAVEGEPDWLISAVWLCAESAQFLATSSTKVLSDGYIARPLSIEQVDEFVANLRCELPDISARLIARGSDADLPQPETPGARKLLHSCPPGPYSTDVLIRVAARAATTHRVACGLLFDFQTKRLLVGTDPGTAAMVLSEDEALIQKYLAGCERMSAARYLSRY